MHIRQNNGNEHWAEGVLATEINVQKHKQPPCTKKILPILYATRNGHHRVVHSCTIYLPQDVMVTTHSSQAAVLRCP